MAKNQTLKIVGVGALLYFLFKKATALTIEDITNPVINVPLQDVTGDVIKQGLKPALWKGKTGFYWDNKSAGQTPNGWLSAGALIRDLTKAFESGTLAGAIPDLSSWPKSDQSKVNSVVLGVFKHQFPNRKEPSYYIKARYLPNGKIYYTYWANMKAINLPS